MPRIHFRLQARGFQVLAAFLIIACIAAILPVPFAEGIASYTAEPKPMEFYIHYAEQPLDVAGIQTKYIMNTSREFQFQTQNDAYANSFYKPIGQPKIAVDFYLYPNFAGRVNIDGFWQVFLWVNGSAYKPTGFMLQFAEITKGGATVWDSGAINPIVTSSIGQYIDVPVYNYNLSTPLTHTFSVDSTLQVHVEVNAGSSADTRIWFDSQFFPSKAILPARDYARPVEVGTYSYDNTETRLFYYNWSDSQRVVTVRANVTDPFGGYDVKNVKMIISDPAGRVILDNIEMTRKTNYQWQTSFELVFEAEWVYPMTAQLGNYTVEIYVTDNNGFYRGQPFIEENDHVFSIGIITFYNPAFQIIDDVGEPLPKAQVLITWPNGTMDSLPRVATSRGFVNLTKVLPAEYGLTILWKDEVVGQMIVNVDSDGTYKINTKVYQTKINVLSNNAAPVYGAYVIVYSETDLGYGLDITDESGQAVFRLPNGTYRIEVYFNTEYWLKIVTTKSIEQEVVINASTTRDIVLNDFPPPIWATTGFWLVLSLAGISIFACIFIFMVLTHSRLPLIKKRICKH